MKEYNFISDVKRWKEWSKYFTTTEIRLNHLEFYWKLYQPDYLIINDSYDLTRNSFVFQYTDADDATKTYYLYNPLVLWLHHGLYCSELNSYWIADQDLILPTTTTITNSQIQTWLKQGQIISFNPGTVIFNNNKLEDYGKYANPALFSIYSNSFAALYSGYYDNGIWKFNYKENGEEDEGLKVSIPLIYQDRIVYSHAGFISTYSDLPFYSGGKWNNEKLPPMCQFIDGSGEEVILDYKQTTGSYIFDNSKKSYYNINVKTEDKDNLSQIITTSIF